MNNFGFNNQVNDRWPYCYAVEMEANLKKAKSRDCSKKNFFFLKFFGSVTGDQFEQFDFIIKKKSLFEEAFSIKR